MGPFDHRAMLPHTGDGRFRRVSHMLPFVLGTILALASFGLLAWDLGHHRAPYSGYQAPSLVSRWFRYYWLADFPVRFFLRYRRKQQRGPESDSDRLSILQDHVRHS